MSEARIAWLALAIALAPATVGAADDFAYGRRLFLEKAQCSYCHGWAGDGSGDPRSPGIAANLRNSALTRDQLIEVIMCGRPGTAMPHFDELAYTDKRCYDMSEADLGKDVPTFPQSTTLQKREVQIIADYLLAKIVRRGPVTREECEENFGAAARSCADYPAKP